MIYKFKKYVDTLTPTQELGLGLILGVLISVTMGITIATIAISMGAK